ncbi:MAG: hypothetical protein K0S44_197 [Bacteroidetes bacterium]|nr:hypothetical protein [Bacteroidota bacterium]
MALHTKKQFAELCGLATNALAVYIKRQKITLTKDDKIDDSEEKNADFLKKRREKTGVVIPLKVEVPEKKDASPTQDSSKKNKRTPASNGNLSGYELDKELKQAELNKKIADTEHRQLQIEKLRGELIPTEIVKPLFIQHSESIKVAYNEASENLIVIISQKKQLSSVEVADLRKQLVSIVNKSVDAAIAATKKGIKNIVEEYSASKAVGEHG